jgi:2-oxoglutarate dehydrogenase E2 component (dihydrolipoamide succinyltransferase)
MPSVELLMPKMGESIMEATILSWLKKEGDSVKADEPVLEIATDKVDSEVPSEVAGKITKILYNEGDVVAVGAPVAIIETEGGETSAPVESTPQPTSVAKTTEPAVAAVAKTVEQAVATVSPANNGSGRFYSPLVLNIAKEEGIGMAELEAVSGTGKDGRVTKNDLFAYLQNRGAQPAEKTIAPTPAQPKQEVASIAKSSPAATSYSGNVEIIEMDRMRKLIAHNMVLSKQTSAHVTSFVEADVTNIVKWRDKVKSSFEKREGEKITFTPIFIEAVAKALKDYPNVNASIDGTNIILKKDINVGMATALPSGNLIVPVIKNADQLNLVGLTKKVNDLANRARNNKLKPDEIEGGTYTLTNVGSFGNVMGTPIIQQPQVGIMAVGAIKKKPAVLETPDGDVIAIRHMMFLSHTYDHRLIDGSLGGQFVRRVADYLEQFDINREL